MVWATDLKHKFWQDPFLKSELNIIVLQLAFALSLFIISAIFFNYIYQDVLKTVIYGIMNGIASGKTDSNYITDSVELVKSNRFIIFTFISFILTMLFTFLVSRITLQPAKNALESQKRFISDIAHELRTPLAIIKTNSEVALMESDLSPKIVAVIKSNVEELDRMSQIINNLLSLKNMIRPENIKFNDVNIGPIIDSVIDKLKDLAEKKHLQIIVKKITPHVVWGNPVALEQIVTNLLKNAINYTSDNGNITIRVGPDYIGNIILHIEDTGIGITKKDLLHIFEPFYRAEGSRNRKNGSSGLGLTIVSELVKMHSGRLTVRSAENKGTTVLVTLPYSKNASSTENVDFSELNEISMNFLGKNRSS